MKIRITILLLLVLPCLYGLSTTIYAQDKELEMPDGEESSIKQREQYEIKLKYYQSQLVRKEEIHGPDNLRLVSILFKIAEIHKALDQDAEAEAASERALAIHKKVWGKEHSNMAIYQEKLAKNLGKQSEQEQEEWISFTNEISDPASSSLNKLQSYQSKLVRIEKLYGTDNLFFITTLTRIATLHKILGQDAEAEAAYKRVSAIQKKMSDELDKASDESDKAMKEMWKELRKTFGKQQKGLDELGEALDILGLKNPTDKLPQIFEKQVEQAEAEWIASKKKRSDWISKHSRYQENNNNLSTFDKVMSRLDELKSDEIMSKPLSETFHALGIDPDLAFGGRAAVYLWVAEGLRLQNLGQFAEAEHLLQRSLAQFDKDADSDSHWVLWVETILGSLADLYIKQNQYAKADPLYQRLLSIMKKKDGIPAPYEIASYRKIANFFWQLGGQDRLANALEIFKKINHTHTHYIQSLLPHGSEQEKHNILSVIVSDIDNTISFQQSIEKVGRKDSLGTESVHLALSIILQRKGRILDNMSAGMSILRKRMSPEDKALLDQLSEVNRERSRLYNLAHQNIASSEHYFSQKKELELQAYKLENKISQSSAEFLTQTQLITLENVQQAIPKNAALVEFMRYRPFDPKGKDEQERWGAARYVAYILKPLGNPVAVDLGDAAIIEALIVDFQQKLHKPRDESVMQTARQLDAQIMQPVRQLLGDVDNVFISPDGALNLIPFAALVDEKNRYLLERYHFTYLSSGRDLLRIHNQANMQIASQHDPAIFADVDFDKAGPKHDETIVIARNEPDAEKSGNPRSSDFSQRFSSLSGTKAEANAIKVILPSVKDFAQHNATESALKRLDSPQILHLATHGFFLDDLEEIDPAQAPYRAESIIGAYQSEIPVASKPANPLFDENPLLRSGIALAGANRLESGDDDGILTALEVTGLDLWGTKLVVLSACETGVGEVKNGKGVFGLRRALVIAGSETQVMSLWKVDDHATKDLMVNYYKRFVNNKEGRSEAMRQAQLDMFNSEDRPHPFYWASFIVSGDWRPLDSGALLIAKK